MSLKKKLISGLKWKTASFITKHALSLVVFTTLARLLDPSAFGIIALTYLFNFFAFMVSDLGLGMAIIQKNPITKSQLDSAFWFIIICNFCFFLIATILAKEIASLLGDPQIEAYLPITAFSLVISSVTTIHSSLCYKELDFKTPSIRLVLSNIAGGSVGICLAINGFGVWSLIAQQLSSDLIGSLFLWKSSAYRPAFRFSIHQLRGLFSIGVPVFTNSVISFFSARLDQFILGRYIGTGPLGLYVIAYKIPELAKSVTHQPISEVLLPAFSKMQNDHVKIKHSLNSGLKMVAFAGFPIFIGLAIISNELIPILIGSKWQEATHACALLSLLSLVGLIQVFFYPILIATGNTNISVYLNVARLVGTTIACFSGIEHGPTGIATALLCNSLVFLNINLIAMSKSIDLSIKTFYGVLSKPAISSIAMSISVYFILELFPSISSAPHIIITKITIGVMTYVLLSMIIDRTTIIAIINLVKKAAPTANPN